MRLQAQWIWTAQDDYNRYNDAMEARRRFYAGAVDGAQMAITADSWYRLEINGAWVADGPCRSWPEHFQYDVLDVRPFLREGDNEIRIVARYWGTGTFRNVCKEAGLLAQLELSFCGGGTQTIGTDVQWDVRPYAVFQRNVPKVSCQMEPYEQIDVRIAEELPSFQPAAARYGALEGPWADLHGRDCALLTRTPMPPLALKGASVVNRGWMGWTFLLGNVLYPGQIDADSYTSMACVIAVVIEAEEAGTLRLEAPHMGFSVDGHRNDEGVFELDAGPHLLLMAVKSYFNHDMRYPWLRVIEAPAFTLRNPLKPQQDNPWTVVRREAWRIAMPDYLYMAKPEAEKEAYQKTVRDGLVELLRTATADELVAKAGGDALFPEAADFIGEAPHEQFVSRDVLGDAGDCLDTPQACCTDSAECTTVLPSQEGDIELCFDFGQQTCGYYEFELEAAAGTIVDISGIEYITAEGVLQHTGVCRNGLRYTCCGGANRFLSHKRRSQRYAFLTLRHQTGPVRIRCFRIVESTYPVAALGSFACSERSLDRIWQISARTLQLCMEDTFTDCPLYEQVCWVGDMRNEALCGYTAYGETALPKRCIRLAGQSLDHYPIVQSQVPSTWGTLIPAWSFLWGLAIWDHYAFSGDEGFLHETWPWVLKNLEGARTFLNDQNLLETAMWNFWDWTNLDYWHRGIPYNTMLLIGAVDAAIQCGEVLGKDEEVRRLGAWRTELAEAVHALWNPDKQAYPDSIHEDGSVSEQVNQHTSVLAYLFGIAPKHLHEALLRNITDPPEGMVRIGGAGAQLYNHEALERAGKQERIIDDIRESYEQMLREGATTTWESFATGTTGRGGFPTRSHAHAWSAGPIRWFNRILLGILPQPPGADRVVISPRPCGLSWARGATCTIKGPVHVDWTLEQGRMTIHAAAPEGVELTFESNPALAHIETDFHIEAPHVR